MSESDEIMQGYVDALANRIEAALPAMHVRIFPRDATTLRWVLARTRPAENSLSGRPGSGANTAEGIAPRDTVNNSDISPLLREVEKVLGDLATVSTRSQGASFRLAALQVQAKALLSRLHSETADQKTGGVR